VDEVHVKVGSTTAPGIPAFRVVNLSNLVAKAEIAESYGVNVQKGDEAIIEFPDLNKAVTGKISFVARTIDAMSRSFTIEVSVRNDDPRYRPNMIALIKTVSTQCDSCIVVPVNAVLTGTDGKYVVVTQIDGDKTVAERRGVKVGSVYKGEAVITDGLSPGERVVVKGYYGLTNGQPLSVQSAATDTP
jgi:RND family efflux transporter MFP subunit